MNAWCDVFSRSVAVGTRVSVGVVCSSIFCLYIMCSHVCSVFYWLRTHNLFEVNAWFDVFSRFVAVGTRVSVGVFCYSIFCLIL